MKKLILDPFFGAKTFEKSVELAMSMNVEIFSPKDVGVSYTNINYWDKKGILSSQRKNETQWRNFSFIDYAWIRVIAEMRDLGVPVELIKEAKDFLFDLVDVKPLFKDFKKKIDEIKKAMSFPEAQKDEIINIMLEGGKKANEEGLTHFYIAITQSIILKIPTSILLFKNGGVVIWYEGKDEFFDKEIRELKLFESHISISISKIIKDFLLDKNSVYLLPELKLLEPNEIRLMELIHTGNYDTISINFLDKKMKHLKLTKSENPQKKIVDILQEGLYQDIELKSHKGMITKISNTVKVMLD